MLRSLLICLSLVLFSAVCAAQGSVELRRANSLRYADENGQRVQELTGDVLIVKDSLNITCEQALYYPDSGRLFFRNNVQFQDGQRLLFADEVRYSDWTEELEARGDVRIYQDSIVIYCDRALYRERLGNGFLYDNVRVRYEPRGVILNGGIGFFDHRVRDAWVTRDPVLTSEDSLGAVNTRITGDTISYSDSKRRATTIGDVKIVRDSLTAYGALLDFFTDSLFANLSGEPLALSGADSISGDSLRLFFEGEQLEHVEVEGNAHATSPADSLPNSPRHILTGQQMTLWIENSLLSRALVEGTATATYFVRDRDAAQGMNVTSGDVLTIGFDNRRISKIRVEGGTQGTYTPESLLAVPATNSKP